MNTEILQISPKPMTKFEKGVFVGLAVTAMIFFVWLLWRTRWIETGPQK